jgi:hypothetical protein
MCKEMAALGFEYIELSHGIRITLVPGILRAVEEGIVKISSTHNFCPLPTGVVQAAPNLFQPSSSDHREHEQWLRHTRRALPSTSRIAPGHSLPHSQCFGLLGSPGVMRQPRSFVMALPWLSAPCHCNG